MRKYFTNSHLALRWCQRRIGTREFWSRLSWLWVTRATASAVASAAVGPPQHAAAAGGDSASGDGFDKKRRNREHAEGGYGGRGGLGGMRRLPEGKGVRIAGAHHRSKRLCGFTSRGSRSLFLSRGVCFEIPPSPLRILAIFFV